MSLYTLLAPAVVGQFHYVRVPAQPIEVDDETAADLIVSGTLVPYPPAVVVAEPEPVTDDADTTHAVDTATDPETPGRTRRRRPHEG